jgi:homoserine O-acetyltransferase/O-succinyltransferase
LSGNTDVASWWPGLFGPGKALDPQRDFIVCANVLGGCYGSAGPASHGSDFPDITVADMVQQQRALADHLGVRGIALVLGGSMGGFQALQWAIDDARVQRLAIVASAARQPPQAVALADMQCQAIRLDPNYNNGHYHTDQPPNAGLALARQLGHLSYRCESELNKRFDRSARADGTLQVLSYLAHQGDKLVHRFDANCYLRITEAMNRFELTAAQLARIAQRTLVVSVNSDWLYPPQEQASLAKALPHAELLSIDSASGHDGFLLDAERFAEALLRHKVSR